MLVLRNVTHFPTVAESDGKGYLDKQDKEGKVFSLLFCPLELPF